MSAFSLLMCRPIEIYAFYQLCYFSSFLESLYIQTVKPCLNTGVKATEELTLIAQNFAGTLCFVYFILYRIMCEMFVILVYMLRLFVKFVHRCENGFELYRNITFLSISFLTQILSAADVLRRSYFHTL